MEGVKGREGSSAAYDAIHSIVRQRGCVEERESANEALIGQAH